jgi:cell division protease FtsH
MSRDELLDRIRVLLAGRASEVVVFGEVSTGASDDIEKASEIARQMLTVYGMSEHAPNLSLVSQRGTGYLGQTDSRIPCSDELERELDREVVALLGSCFAEAKTTLETERSLLEGLAKQLLEHEQLDQAEVEAILGPKPAAPPWAHPPGARADR